VSAYFLVTYLPVLALRETEPRRDEIRRLAVDCLDTYPDGHPRLRSPVGKGYSERSTPLHPQAAEALQPLIDIAREQHGRSRWDASAGREVQHIFIVRGKLLSKALLFDLALAEACAAAGLVDSAGKATITAHRFQYQDAPDRHLGPDVTLAGPAAEALREHRLDPEAVSWLQTNFLKTELELGHCLRTPAEGPCECDLVLTCSKFLTTSDYTPRLQARLTVEQQLIDDATERNWQREVERHTATKKRIEQLLRDLRELRTRTSNSAWSMSASSATGDGAEIGLRAATRPLCGACSRKSRAVAKRSVMDAASTSSTAGNIGELERWQVRAASHGAGRVQARLRTGLRRA